MGKIIVKCPKCGQRNIYTPTKDDIAAIADAGIARVGFLHDNHVFIIDFDSSSFVRGAYITNIHNIHPHTKIYFDDYRVIFSPIIGIQTQFIWIAPIEKIIDLRACPLCLADLYPLLKSIISFIQQYGSKIQFLPKIAGMLGKTFNIIHSDNYVLFSPQKSDDIKYKTFWLRLLCNNFRLENLSDEVLKNIIAYIDKNGNREPNNDDIEKLRKFT
ncbi:MAG: hypothetical protein Q6363_009045 [Candidatus Njordarchaeota archaeon]